MTLRYERKRITLAVVAGQGFVNLGLARTGFANAAKLNTIIRGAFAAVQMPQYTPDAFRKTLMYLGAELCHGPEAFKAWSMNLGHEKGGHNHQFLPARHDQTADGIDPRHRGLGRGFKPAIKGLDAKRSRLGLLHQRLQCLQIHIVLSTSDATRALNAASWFMRFDMFCYPGSCRPTDVRS